MNGETTERASLDAINRDWATCRGQIDPFFDPRTQPQSSQQFGLARDHLARWIAYFEQHYLQAAQGFQRTGQPSLHLQLAGILDELQSHLHKFESAFRSTAATEMDIKASIERAHQYITTAREDMMKSQDAAFKKHNELWQKQFDASWHDVWRDVDAFQRAGDAMWRSILNRPRR